MSSPPHFYASRPSSRQNTRPTSPPTNAELRTQAIAKLKRAASLPRTPAGRRPAQTADQNNGQPAVETSDIEPHRQVTTGYGGEEEFLSPSPHSNMSEFPTPIAMQRSASASSSFHIPTPPLSRAYDTSSPSNYYTAVSTPSGSTTPDWAAMQLAQSYLPSLSPVNSSTNPYHPVPGRSTPSPLPSLGALQRSHSAAARAKAMTKLTGVETPVPQDDFCPPLQRADSLGTARMLDMAILRPGRAQTPEAAPAERRPRLQRSFTVSSSNMGEERRSAVGRRMVERLAKSKAAREAEEAEVRRMWEERVGAKAAAQDGDGEDLGHSEDQIGQGEDGDQDYGNELEDPILHGPVIPRLERHSPVEPAYDPTSQEEQPSHLPVPDRTLSRTTVRSADEAFEYESHLRRSLSSRTARQELAEATPNTLSPPPPPYEVETMEDDHATPLAPPLAPFATPTKHMQHASTSTQGTIHASQETSPSSSVSRDGLQSMMFIMGDHGQPVNNAIRRDGSWPMEVEDAGSEWGTPAKHHEPTFNDAPYVHSPLATTDEAMPSHPSDDSLKRTATRPESDMSWEEVGGAADREVPSDPRYHGRKDSVSAKIKRTVETAMRKRSQSRSSVGSSTSYSRRGSESSISPSFQQPPRSTTRGPEVVSHQPSLNSLAPSQVESSANSILLQHQLSADPSQISLVPRAELTDPRIHSSKLTAFPGLHQLERKPSYLEEPPRLIHQASDSAVPSVQRANQPLVGEIYNLPLPSDSSRRTSEDATKKGWLAKAFGPSPRSSGSVSRKSSIPDLNLNRKPPSPPSTSSSSIESDPFAGPSLPQIVKATKQRGLYPSPAVSIVQESSEEGSRMTRFTQNRQPSPMIEENEPVSGLGIKLPPKSMEVLERMDKVLKLENDDPARPEILDDPPRKLLLATQVLQVVNAHTVKDRYLFLFNDVLVIAKPLITTGIHANLDTRFIVKSVVSLDKLVLSGITPEEIQPTERHPVVQNFIDKFAEDAVKAVKYLVERSNPKVDPITLASLLFKTPELDRTQIGMLLAHNTNLLEAFVDRFHFAGIDLVQALRMFLLSIRLPVEVTASETLLRGFSHRYFEVNKDHLEFDRDTTSDLVLSVMQLDDSLYSTFGKFAFENRDITLEDYVAIFVNNHPRTAVTHDMLEEMYWSIKQNRLGQALASADEALSREVEIAPARLPTKLTCDTWSEPISLAIPDVDREFKIRLVGEGMDFEPSILDFAKDRVQTFRVKGKTLGIRSVLFDRLGANAPLYASLGSARTFTIERSFMQHTFQLTFVSHLGIKRKYCFSVQDSQTRDKWISTVQKQIRATLLVKTRAIPIGHASKIQQAAENVALQVLRDALIPPEEKDLPAPTSNMGGAHRAPWTGQHGIKKSISLPRNNRKGSISVAYGTGDETEDRDYEQERQAGLVGTAQTGKELVLLCRQNSLLPSLLQLLQAGIGQDTVLENGPMGVAKRNGARV